MTRHSSQLVRTATPKSGVSRRYKILVVSRRRKKRDAAYNFLYPSFTAFSFFLVITFLETFHAFVFIYLSVLAYKYCILFFNTILDIQFR